MRLVVRAPALWILLFINLTLRQFDYLKSSHYCAEDKNIIGIIQIRLSFGFINDYGI